MSLHRADTKALSVQSTADEKAVDRLKSGDIALDLACELDAGYVASPEVERRVLRKIDFILLPLISCTATLSFLDKVSNNYANNVSLTCTTSEVVFISSSSCDLMRVPFSTAFRPPLTCTVTSSRGVLQSSTLPSWSGSLLSRT